MSEEFCAGVQIILKRMESNPDEFINPHEYKWQKVVAGVFARKEGISTEGVGAVRGLTDAEIDALYEGFVKLARPAFDEYVMKNVLDDKEELRYKATERYVAGFNDPRMLAQNSIRPGSIIPVGGGGGTGTTYVQGQLDAEPSPAFIQKIKKGLGL